MDELYEILVSLPDETLRSYCEELYDESFVSGELKDIKEHGIRELLANSGLDLPMDCAREAVISASLRRFHKTALFLMHKRPECF